MDIIRRLFAIWLMLSVLGLGTAWAYDGHGIFPEHVTAFGALAHDAQGDGDSADCDHCCHLGFHLLGMLSDAIAPAHGCSQLSLSSPAYHPTSAPRSPPVRPPRS